MGSVREPVNTGAAEPGTGVGRQRQLAGRDGDEAAAEVLEQEAGVVTRDTQSGPRTEDRQVTGETNSQGETREDLEGQTVEQLRGKARERNVEGSSSMNKGELVDALMR